MFFNRLLEPRPAQIKYGQYFQAGKHNSIYLDIRS